MPRRAARRPRRSRAGAGLGTLLIGLVLGTAGIYFLTNQVEVGAGPFGGFAWFGPNSFGLLLLPLLLGVGLLCVNERYVVGRLLTGVGALIVLASVLDTFRITFRPTSLFNTLMMLGLSIAGVGLIARVLLGSRVEVGGSDQDVTDYEDDEKDRLRVQLATAQDRIRALEAPQQDKQVIDEQLNELVRQKTQTPGPSEGG